MLRVDAWIREAEEAASLIEDLEGRIKNKKPEHQQSLNGSRIARSKLLEVGVKLDRLESLLHNPPSNPILTDQDLNFRWKMLSDSQIRTRVVALYLYPLPPSTRRPESLLTLDPKRTTTIVDIYNQDDKKAALSKEDPELLTPLLSNDSTSSVKQINIPTSFSSKGWLNWKACCIILGFLGMVAFVIVLFIVCAII